MDDLHVPTAVLIASFGRKSWVLVSKRNDGR